MTSLASQPTQTQPEATSSKPSKDPNDSTPSTKFDVPVPAEQVLDDGETVVGTDESPETENKFRSAVEKLRDAIEGYNTAVAQNADEKTIEKHEQNVIQALKETAENSPNPQVKEYYKAKALEFMKVGRTAKKVLTNDIIKGVLFILASPVALLSSVVVSTGGLVYGLGSVVKGVGDLMSGMTFSGTVLGSKDEPKTQKKDAGVQQEEEEKEGEQNEDKIENGEAAGEEKEGEVAEGEDEGEHTVENTTTDEANGAK
ncbi:hypothetical protein J3R30DRAFT_3401415 [Lentinula aciculospora]|uniref:Uncharacterized protein n=1 Tax=Lentinula aciculospora TaxID=153920 RepID=A0A9W9AQ13_9AGAR|nr:hypothetical protein J3R30DRAFT_3401415 [Lentinula aciculospora]